MLTYALNETTSAVSDPSTVFPLTVRSWNVTAAVVATSCPICTPEALATTPVPAKTLTPSEVTTIPLAASTAIASALTVIPLAAPTASVGVDPSPVASPVKPLPAVIVAT